MITKPAKPLIFTLIPFFASLGILATGLPFRDVSAIGQICTISYYLLNPPFIVVMFLAPYDNHTAEYHIWLKFQYPSAIFISALWWVCLYFFFAKRSGNKQNTQNNETDWHNKPVEQTARRQRFFVETLLGYYSIGPLLTFTLYL